MHLGINEEITEDEMIAEFLLAEVDSPRHGPRLKEFAGRLSIHLAVVRNPDCAAHDDNRQRRDLLTEYRGWTRYESVFGGLPTASIEWRRADLHRADLDHVEVIQWLVDEFPDSFPGRPLGTVRDAAQQASTPHSGIAEMASTMSEGRQPARPILITTPTVDRVVILEGHNRLLAYALLGEMAPLLIPVIVGITAEAGQWSEW